MFVSTSGRHTDIKVGVPPTQAPQESLPRTNPSAGKMAFVTTQFASNSPIANIDLDGLEHYYAASGEYLGKYGKSNEIRILNYGEFAFVAKADLDNPKLNKLKYLGVTLRENSVEAFDDRDQIALDFAFNHNGKSHKEGVEYGAKIFSREVVDGEGNRKELFVLGKVRSGGDDQYGNYVDLDRSYAPNGFGLVGWGTDGGVHTHIPLKKNQKGNPEAFSAYSNEYNPMEKGDKWLALQLGGFYLATPKGVLKLWEHDSDLEENGTETIIYDGVPRYAPFGIKDELKEELRPSYDYKTGKIFIYETPKLEKQNPDDNNGG